MKLIVKTLAGKQLPLEVEETWTIRQIKEQIEKDHSMAADTLKLIAYGKVLDSDEKVATDYNLKEGDFIVAMVQKAKPAPKKKEEPPAQTQPPVAEAQPAQAQPQPEASQPAATQPPAQS